MSGVGAVYEELFVLSFQVFWKYKTDLKHKAYYKNSDNKNKWSLIKIPLNILLSLLNWDKLLSLYLTIIYRKYSMWRNVLNYAIGIQSAKWPSFFSKLQGEKVTNGEPMDLKRVSTRVSQSSVRTLFGFWFKYYNFPLPCCSLS